MFDGLWSPGYIDCRFEEAGLELKAAIKKSRMLSLFINREKSNLQSHNTEVWMAVIVKIIIFLKKTKHLNLNPCLLDGDMSSF